MALAKAGGRRPCGIAGWLCLCGAPPSRENNEIGNLGAERPAEEGFSPVSSCFIGAYAGGRTAGLRSAKPEEDRGS
jgi:hypothetical protein